MYLKSIEAQGFKSFAYKTRLEFLTGITAIVGPNGSGKSNVVDAVRWALGEQSPKQLRGGAMQDVIFSGTQTRKPLSYAFVSITLDNTDHFLPIAYDEITVTRKLYRSGESDYLINGNSCRLKDISEMFIDTGIGREGYSVIDQGQVEKMLSGRPEDKRELFDEAAGIGKYKRRKEVTLKKLQDEKENLTRVNDILFELEKQIGPLKEQSDRALEYLRKKEELKRCEINIFLLTTDRIKSQISLLTREIKQASDKLEEASSEYETAKEKYAAIEEEVEKIDSSIDEAKRKFHQTTLLTQQLEGKIEVLKEQVSNLTSRKEKFSEQREEASRAIRIKNSKREELFKEKKELEKKYQEESKAKDKVENLLTTIRARLLENSAKIDEKKNENIKMLKDRAFWEAKQQNFDAERRRLVQRRESIISSMQEKAVDVSNIEKELFVLKENLAALSEKIRDQSQKILQKEAEMNAIQKQLPSKEKDLRELSECYQRENQKLASLKNIAQSYDGYKNSIRKVMEKKKEEPGLLGVVAEIISTDQKYELAIETALGFGAQDIVTDNEQTAKRMIRFLKKNSFGRATFLPLTAIHRAECAPCRQVLAEPGVLGPANLLIRTKEQFFDVVSWLLGKTIVVDDIDNAVLLTKKYRQSLRLVTLEGELISPGGAMTGGSFKNAGALLGRRREIGELEEKVKTLCGKTSLCKKEVNQLEHKRAECSLAIEEMRKLSLKDTAEENADKVQAERLTVHLEAEEEAVKSKQKELFEIEAAQKEYDENEKEMAYKFTESKHQEEKLNDEMGRLTKEVKAEQEKEKELQKTVEEARLSCSAIQQRIGFISENITQIEEETSSLKDKLEKLNHQGGDADQVREKEEEIGALKKTVESSEEIFRDLEEEIKTYTAKKEELSIRHKDFFKKREELSAKIAELDRDCFRKKDKKKSCEENYEKQIERMWEEYELTYHNALKFRNENEKDLFILKEQMSALKNELKDGGPINTSAIEDYKNFSKRYEFLKNQRDDIKAAEESLAGIIAAVDREMRKRFQKQFGKIEREFDAVFKQLFGGGSGSLELTQGEDILEAGIKVTVQPPGKKVQNMSQLSGGEKALSAISLLFAIQNLKPSPFCLLDEIESPLDDNNVARFAQYLKTLTKKTQFIVITHRRGIMTFADRLYGITMQEKGVSSLVSVDLIENELTK